MIGNSFEQQNYAPKFDAGRLVPTKQEHIPHPKQAEVTRKPGRHPFRHDAPAFNINRIISQNNLGQQEKNPKENFELTEEIKRIQHELNGDHPHLHKQPIIKVMAALIEKVGIGKIEPSIAAKWINDELKKMNPAYLKEIRNMVAKHQHHEYLQRRHEELLLIDEFLDDNLPLDNSPFE